MQSSNLGGTTLQRRLMVIVLIALSALSQARANGNKVQLMFVQIAEDKGRRQDPAACQRCPTNAVFLRSTGAHRRASHNACLPR